VAHLHRDEAAHPGPAMERAEAASGKEGLGACSFEASC